MNKLTKSLGMNTGKAFFEKRSNRKYMFGVWKYMLLAMVVTFALAGNCMPAFATDYNGSGSFDTVVSTIVTWVKRIGGVVAFIGGIQFGFAFKHDDADGKTKGLMTLASGFIVIALCLGYSTLFKQS